MTRLFLEDEAVCVPAWVNDLESFRRWTEDALPESGQLSFLLGEVWIDLNKEQHFSHNQAKSEISATLRTLVKGHGLGRHFSHGIYFSNFQAAFSTQPDGTFVSAEALREKRVVVIEGRMEGHVELEGSPDMILEVVSRSSVEKDTEVLRQPYATAGVREYWLVDARGDTLKFDVLRLSRGSYAAVRKRAGWVRSEVLDH